MSSLKGQSWVFVQQPCWGYRKSIPHVSPLSDRAPSSPLGVTSRCHLLEHYLQCSTSPLQLHSKSKLVYCSAMFHRSCLTPAGELWAAVRERNGSLWALILAGTCSFQISSGISTASPSNHGCVLIHLFPNKVYLGCLSFSACTFLFLVKLRMKWSSVLVCHSPSSPIPSKSTCFLQPSSSAHCSSLWILYILLFLSCFIL